MDEDRSRVFGRAGFERLFPRVEKQVDPGVAVLVHRDLLPGAMKLFDVRA